MNKLMENKEKYTYQDLLDITARLRGEDGCPWDREQTHQSIRKNLIEEAYEVAEAIDAQSAPMLQEELGDLLFQVVFHSQLAGEEGAFDQSDVVDGICRKLILRHPHVFGDVKVDGTSQVLSNWEDIKKVEKGYESQTQVLRSVPAILPALMRSYKVQQKAAKVGFDWDSVDGAWDKLEEERGELAQAMQGADRAQIEEELGDLLFAAVNVSRFLKVDPEEALTRSCEKFISRFAKMEEIAQIEQKSVGNLKIFEWDDLWDRAKQCIMGSNPNFEGK